MKTLTTKLSLGMALVGLTLFGAACGSSTTTSNTSATPNAVTIQNEAFSPATLTVAKGTTVTWTNKDSVLHTVTGNAGGPASDQLSKGDTYQFTFSTAGTFSYRCGNHAFMQGTVVVTE